MPYLSFILNIIFNNLYTKWKFHKNCHTLAVEITTYKHFKSETPHVET
jgi:hypothetical protein